MFVMSDWEGKTARLGDHSDHQNTRFRSYAILVDTIDSILIGSPAGNGGIEFCCLCMVNNREVDPVYLQRIHYTALASRSEGHKCYRSVQVHTYALPNPFYVLKSIRKMTDIVSLSAKIIPDIIQPYLVKLTVRITY